MSNGGEPLILRDSDAMNSHEIGVERRGNVRREKGYLGDLARLTAGKVYLRRVILVCLFGSIISWLISVFVTFWCAARFEHADTPIDIHTGPWTTPAVRVKVPTLSLISRRRKSAELRWPCRKTVLGVSPPSVDSLRNSGFQLIMCPIQRVQ